MEAAPRQSDDERTPSWPKLKSSVSPQCTACARLVDNFKMALLPKLKKRHDELIKHHSRSRLAKTATVGELEAIVEEEVDRICSWPRSFHDPRIRKACNKLVEERAEQLVVAISSWARDGSYGLHLSGEISSELRPALCEHELEVCTAEDLEELTVVDADEKTKLDVANETGFVKERPIESEPPSNAKDGVLVRVVAGDFSKRIVEEGADVDWLVYMYFPGRTVEVDDTHARLRPKFVRLAEFLDAPGSNRSLAGTCHALPRSHARLRLVPPPSHACADALCPRHCLPCGSGLDGLCVQRHPASAWHARAQRHHRALPRALQVAAKLLARPA